MKRVIFQIIIILIFINPIFSDELMENLKNASDQVAQDLSSFIKEENLYAGAITFESKPVLIGDLFSDLIANRLLDNNRFKGNIIKGYSPGTFRMSDADWNLSGSLYKAGSTYFLSMYLNDSQGNQKKGWEFLIPSNGTDSLLEPSQMILLSGGDIYEPNNTVEQAVELVLDPRVEISNLQIGEMGDADWFYLDVEEVSSEISLFILTVKTTGSLDTYLELYGPDDSSYPIAENDDGDDSNAKITFPLTKKGRWFIKAKGYSAEETGEYGLFMSLEKRVAGPGEPDNNMEQASILRIEGDELNRTADYGMDYDYFKITIDRVIPDNKALVIQTYSSLDLSMTLFDEYENEVMTNDDSGEESNPKIVLSEQEAGTWYVVVYPYDDSNLGNYKIKTFLIDVIKDNFENDNSKEMAKEIEANSPLQERTFMPANEEDWAKLIVNERSEYIIKTTGGLDTNLTLYNGHGEFIYEDDDSGNDDNALITEMLDEGIYYIKVTQYEGEGNSEDSYFLSVRKY